VVALGRRFNPSRGIAIIQTALGDAAKHFRDGVSIPHAG